ncbi:STAS domain-containing protein [Streptomyces sp. cg35]|uniref:STAS domain-containing protein n=1 Tax=Streptomyces sp. cg35 TaxID=3421650 RepID=UPI003D17B68D
MTRAPYDSNDEGRHTHRSVTINRTDAGATATISVLGFLEWDTTEELVAHIEKAAGTPTVVIDLRGLVWADSALLHALINTQRHLRRSDSVLMLRGPLQPVLQRLFELTGTTSYFAFC